MTSSTVAKTPVSRSGMAASSWSAQGRSAGRQSSGRRYRLNARGKVIAFLLGLALVFGGLGIGAQFAESSTGPQAVVSYTVRPGDSVWTYAALITPAGEDVNANVDRIMKINNLSTPNLQAGDRLLVPSDQG